MKSKKQLGIWMDHSNAFLLQLTNNTIETSTLPSKPDSQLNEADLYYKDESHRLNKEQGLLSAYYRKLGEVIQDYDEVLLFGPTDAKSELLNLLKDNPLFDKVKIEAKPADKMTAVQQQTFVKEYFNITG